MKTIYHGSKDIIKKPEFGKGKKYNDYGLGFYCTENIDLAKEWAVDKNRGGFANVYTMDCSGLTVLDLNSGEYCILTWLAVLLENREFDISAPLALEAKAYISDNFMVNYEDYDIITGYRADDSYFSFAQDFISGTISYRQLNNAMHLGRLGQQFVLKSEKAFEKIRFEKAEPAENSVWFKKKIFTDKSARREYFDLERNKRQRGDIYITRIIDEEMTADDLLV